MELLETLEIQHKRFAALRQLIAREIPCILWGEDALTFGHNVWSWRTLEHSTGTARPSHFDQQILVPDELLDAAAAVLEEGEYKRTSEPDEKYVEIFRGRDRAHYALPKCIRLRHVDTDTGKDGFKPHKIFPTPRYILLLPQSYYALDTRSASRFKSLVPPLDSSNADILVPNYNTFLEGLVHFWMYPPTESWTPLQFSNGNFIDDLIRLRRKGRCNFRPEILSEIQTEDCAWYLGQRLYSRSFQDYQRGENLEEYKRQKELRQSFEAQKGDAARLSALRQLIANDVPCILWGEDALFAHAIPIALDLFDQQILIPDELLDKAADILEEGKYMRTPDPQSHRNYFARFASDGRGLDYAFPRSIRLQHVDIPDSDDRNKLWPLPQHILLLPQSYYGLNTRSVSRFQSLVPAVDSSKAAAMLLPKFNTFLEGLVHFLMHPPSGRPSQDSARFHSIFIHYLTVCRSKLVPDVKEDILSQIKTEDGAWYMNLKLSRRQGVRSHEIEEYKRQKELLKPVPTGKNHIVNSNAPFHKDANKIQRQIMIREYSTALRRALDKNSDHSIGCLQMHAPARAPMYTWSIIQRLIRSCFRP